MARTIDPTHELAPCLSTTPTPSWMLAQDLGTSGAEIERAARALRSEGVRVMRGVGKARMVRVSPSHWPTFRVLAEWADEGN